MRNDDLIRQPLHDRDAPGPMRGTWARVVGALIGLAEGHGELVTQTERPWASATFSGSRHTIALQFHGNDAVEAAEALISGLEDHEFHLPGQIVADARIAAVRMTALPEPVLEVEAELLLLDDR